MYVFLDFYTIVYIYIFCGIVCYLDSIYIILAAVIIISSIIYIYFCVMHSVNFSFVKYTCMLVEVHVDVGNFQRCEPLKTSV